MDPTASRCHENIRTGQALRPGPLHPALLRKAGGDCGNEGRQRLSPLRRWRSAAVADGTGPAGRRAQPQAVPRLSGGGAGAGNAADPGQGAGWGAGADATCPGSAGGSRRFACALRRRVQGLAAATAASSPAGLLRLGDEAGIQWKGALPLAVAEQRHERAWSLHPGF